MCVGVLVSFFFFSLIFLQALPHFHFDNTGGLGEKETNEKI